jgi:hypothetical protein
MNTAQSHNKINLRRREDLDGWQRPSRNSMQTIANESDRNWTAVKPNPSIILRPANGTLSDLKTIGLARKIVALPSDLLSRLVGWFYSSLLQP